MPGGFCTGSLGYANRDRVVSGKLGSSGETFCYIKRRALWLPPMSVLALGTFCLWCLGNQESGPYATTHSPQSHPHASYIQKLHLQSAGGNAHIPYLSPRLLSRYIRRVA